MSYIYEMEKIKRKPGPPKVYSVRIVLPLEPDIIEGIENALKPTESRSSFIRQAIAHELKRRQRNKARN